MDKAKTGLGKALHWIWQQKENAEKTKNELLEQRDPVDDWIIRANNLEVKEPQEEGFEVFTNLDDAVNRYKERWGENIGMRVRHYDFQRKPDLAFAQKTLDRDEFSSSIDAQNAQLIEEKIKADAELARQEAETIRLIAEEAKVFDNEAPVVQKMRKAYVKTGVLPADDCVQPGESFEICVALDEYGDLGVEFDWSNNPATVVYVGGGVVTKESVQRGDELLSINGETDPESLYHMVQGINNGHRMCDLYFKFREPIVAPEHPKLLDVDVNQLAITAGKTPRGKRLSRGWSARSLGEVGSEPASPLSPGSPRTKMLRKQKSMIEPMVPRGNLKILGVEERNAKLKFRPTDEGLVDAASPDQTASVVLPIQDKNNITSKDGEICSKQEPKDIDSAKVEEELLQQKSENATEKSASSSLLKEELVPMEKQRVSTSELVPVPEDMAVVDQTVPTNNDSAILLTPVPSSDPSTPSPSPNPETPNTAVSSSIGSTPMVKLDAPTPPWDNDNSNNVNNDDIAYQNINEVNDFETAAQFEQDISKLDENIQDEVDQLISELQIDGEQGDMTPAKEVTPPTTTFSSTLNNFYPKPGEETEDKELIQFRCECGK